MALYSDKCLSFLINSPKKLEISSKKSISCWAFVRILSHCLLIRSIPALNLAVTPDLHADTGAVLAGELVVIAGSHCHVPAVLRATGVIGDLPGGGPQQQGPCRGRADCLEIVVLGAPGSPLGSVRVIPAQSVLRHTKC